MKKYSFLIYHADYMQFLGKIREAGTLHVIEKSSGVSEDPEISRKIQLITLIKSTLKNLDKLIVDRHKFIESKQIAEVALLEKIIDEMGNMDDSREKLSALQAAFQRMSVWGEYDQELIEKLELAGYKLHFYSCRINKYQENWTENYSLFEISEADNLKNFVIISRPDEVVDIEADIFELSDKNALELQKEIEIAATEIQNKLEKFRILIENSYSEIFNLRLKLESEIDLRKVVLHTETEAGNKVMILEGWCPVDQSDLLEKMLEENRVYYEVSLPQDVDKVPIKLKNNKFAKLYEVIGDLYDLPDYHEIDLTPFFAPFFMLFFGLCLGDAAYGLLFIILAIILKRKAKPAMKAIYELMIWLGSATVLMGIITGTFFGFSLTGFDIPFLNHFKQYMLDSDKLFYFSLILGVIQILFGMIIKAVGQVIRFGWAASLSTWGWLILLLGAGGAYTLNYFSIITAQKASYAYYIFGGIAVLLIFLLNNFKRNPLINIGAGLWDTYNMVTGLLGDVLSYIRLFALGISGSVMGFVFNDLAIKMSGDIPVISPILMILIMLIGHGINIFMSALGAFVHPLRLTFVEFYKNAGFQGGGKKYKPFSRII